MGKDSHFILTDAEEAQLGELISQGDQKALDKLVTSNLGFVVSLARQYADKGLELDDLVSEGNIALMLAAMKWDASKGQRFVQYAVWDIRKAMERAIEQQVPIVKKPHTDKTYVSQVSMDAPLRPGYTRSLGESMPQKNQVEQTQITDESSFDYELLQSLHVLNEREQNIIRLYYGVDGDSLNMSEIAQMMNLKRERVRQIRKKAERKLRKPMRNMR